MTAVCNFISLGEKMCELLDKNGKSLLFAKLKLSLVSQNFLSTACCVRNDTR